jgi:hypothetical protein
MKKYSANLISFLAFASLFACGRRASLSENRQYLIGIASHLNRYKELKGDYPASLDECLKQLNIMLPHRGDANGKTLYYYRFGNEACMLRSVGRNGRDERGQGDDLDIYLVKGKEVDRKGVLEYARKEGGDILTAILIWTGSDSK